MSDQTSDPPLEETVGTHASTAQAPADQSAPNAPPVTATWAPPINQPRQQQENMSPLPSPELSANATPSETGEPRAPPLLTPAKPIMGIQPFPKKQTSIPKTPGGGSPAIKSSSQQVKNISGVVPSEQNSAPSTPYTTVPPTGRGSYASSAFGSTTSPASSMVLHGTPLGSLSNPDGLRSRTSLQQGVSIRRLLQGFLSLKDHPAGTWLPFDETDLRLTLSCARARFLAEPSLLEIQTPVAILGDTHGQFHDLLRLFELVGYPDGRNFLFLGDYVDRGKNSLDVIATLFCYKCLFPGNMFLLRGNHEMASTSRSYGFYDEVKRRSGVGLWRRFVDVFNCMPPCALVSKRILCMHGGLSPAILDSLDPIREIRRPCECPDSGLLADLLWSDPDNNTTGFRPSDRGISYAFGADVVQRVCEQHDLDLICRAHQVVEDGYEFFAGRNLITIFSAPNYFGEYDNAAGILDVSENLVCTVKTIQPILAPNPPVPVEVPEIKGAQQGGISVPSPPQSSAVQEN
ncbi:unnamed protein product [Amoebophrya sp. A25]|nr:unnamed protein product [Amoebophrya sp. A25]|eukprot:GSA25T00020046001.1